MYGLSSRGLGATQAYCDAMKQQTTVLGTGTYPPSCVWASIFGYDPPTVAPPAAPTGDVLTVPPASGAQAQATVDALVNQQLVDQNALNAGTVTSSWWDTLTGNTYAAGSAAVSTVTSPWLWLGAAAAFLALATFNWEGAPRRYRR